MDRTDGIAAFVEAVEAGSFAAAAQRLNLSRSAVGKAVARLEQRLRTRLFHRTTRAQALTEEGQTYYASCKRALAELRTAEAAIDSGRQEMGGRLRVSMPVLFGRHCVAPLLTALAAAHPELSLELSFSDRRVDLYEDGFDLAVRVGRLPEDADLVARRVAEQRMHLCASPDYLARSGAPRGLDAVAGHAHLAYRRSGRTYAWVFPEATAAPRRIDPDPRLAFDDLEAIADAAVAGLGLAWLPCWLIRPHVERGRLVSLLPPQLRLGMEVHAVRLRTPHLPCRLRVAVDTLAERLPARMGAIP